MGIITRMKFFLAACLLTLTFLSLGWGKHYLVETVDANGADDDANDVVKLDKTRADVETMINSIIKNDRFKSLPEKTQKKIMNNIKDIIDGKKSMDYWYRPQFEKKSFSRYHCNWDTCQHCKGY